MPKQPTPSAPEKPGIARVLGAERGPGNSTVLTLHQPFNGADAHAVLAGREIATAEQAEILRKGEQGFRDYQATLTTLSRDSTRTKWRSAVQAAAESPDDPVAQQQVTALGSESVAQEAARDLR